VAAQLVGAMLAALVGAALFPLAARASDAVAGE
jgi:hypothetical protein